MKDRNDFANVIKGIGVEIGVAQGGFSRQLLTNSKLDKLYSVDPWSMEYEGFACQEDCDESYRMTIETLMEFRNRSVILKMDGYEACKFFADNSLGFVYIDSSHGVEETLGELRLWCPKVKEGGILAGHDYINGLTVQEAVHQFAKETNRTFETTERDQEWQTIIVNSFYFFK